MIALGANVPLPEVQELTPKLPLKLETEVFGADLQTIEDIFSKERTMMEFHVQILYREDVCGSLQKFPWKKERLRDHASLPLCFLSPQAIEAQDPLRGEADEKVDIRSPGLVIPARPATIEVNRYHLAPKEGLHVVNE